ncbi:hypothetical protein SEA_LATRETIUM_107 [Mycobacterium phage Latretium]|nr:hypothetical protein SEA_LATRETIUM_107 [Mycobacterium phage Latretium]
MDRLNVIVSGDRGSPTRSYTNALAEARSIIAKECADRHCKPTTLGLMWMKYGDDPTAQTELGIGNHPQAIFYKFSADVAPLTIMERIREKLRRNATRA